MNLTGEVLDEDNDEIDDEDSNMSNDVYVPSVAQVEFFSDNSNC
jgi:hypothetical protein